MNIRILIAAAVIFLTGCAGLHEQAGRFTATGASVNIFLIQIPKDPMILAQSKVPQDATVTNVNGSPADWHTVLGFLNRFIGIGWVQIGGNTK